MLPLFAFVLATAAYVLGALTASGAAAAAIVGSVALTAGWRWAVVLLLFFVLGTAASRIGARRKAQLTEGVVEKSGARDALQVVANGGVFTACAFIWLYQPESDMWWWAACGALAAATADSMATEIGGLSSRMPRSLLTGRALPAGTSGGVTWLGTLGGAAGALVLAAVASLLFSGGSEGVAVLFIAGITGSLADSALGAGAQARRWCDTCQTATERMVHTCGTSTVHAGGIRWLDNDIVNLAATVAGALAGIAGALLLLA